MNHDDYINYTYDQASRVSLMKVNGNNRYAFRYDGEGIPFANPTDYYIRISWTDVTVINANGKKNKGWLK